MALRISLALLILILPLNIMARDILTEVLIIGGLSPLNDIIEREEIEHFNRHDLRLLRNTIFAKYGYAFKSDDLRKHFFRFSWYNESKEKVQRKLTNIDWMNIALIQSLEKNADTSYHIGNMGEYFILSGEIYGANYSGGADSWENASIRREGFAHNMEITARVNSAIIARQKFTDNNEFRLDLSNIPPDELRHWEDCFERGWLECSDPETKLDFLMLGGYNDLYGQRWPAEFVERGLRDDVIYNDTFEYIYSDRNATVRGVMDGEPYTTLADYKMVKNYSFKKGWNKVKYHRTSIGEYLVFIGESTSESGVFLTVDYDQGEEIYCEGYCQETNCAPDAGGGVVPLSQCVCPCF